MKHLAGYTHEGLRIGETHHRAKYTDHEIDMVRDLHEKEGMGYKKVAKVMDMPLRTVRSICNYTTRTEKPVRFKTPNPRKAKGSTS